MSVETRQSTILPRRPRQRWVWLLGLGSVGLVSVALGVMVFLRVPPTQPPQTGFPILAQVPPFKAVRQDGTTVPEQSWAGSIWVADFIFTRCADSCPALTEKMVSLQGASERRLPRLRLVSFTVDPEFDTPERLSSYGGRYHADPSRWAFLNVPRAALESVSRGLLQTLTRGDGVDLNTVAHSNYLVLIDRRLRVRGFYHSNETDAVDKLLRDAEVLAGLP